MFERGGCYSRLLESRLPPPSLFDTYFILDVLNFVKRHFAKFTCPRVYEFYERGTQFALRGEGKKEWEGFREFCAFYDYTLEYDRTVTRSPTNRASYPFGYHYFATFLNLLSIRMYNWRTVEFY